MDRIAGTHLADRVRRALESAAPLIGGGGDRRATRPRRTYRRALSAARRARVLDGGSRLQPLPAAQDAQPIAALTSARRARKSTLACLPRLRIGCFFTVIAGHR